MIIAVGHTKRYMDNMLGLLPDVPVFKVFNGKGHYPGALHVPNHYTGRDIAMMKSGLDATGWDSAVFINDSVIYIDPRFWDAEGDIVGCANFSSWVDYDKCTSSEIKYHKKKGRKPLFIRTPIFKMTARLFNQLYSRASHNAQAFEKLTLKTDANVNFIPGGWLIDNNLAKYFERQA